MNTLLICLFLASIFPYLSKIPLAFAMNKFGGYDNRHPREQQSRLQGFGARAFAAHQNSFESLLLFAIAVLTAIATHNVSRFIEDLAVIHIIARIFYHLFYLLNWSTLRSLTWAVGLTPCLIILWKCIP